MLCRGFLWKMQLEKWWMIQILFHTLTGISAGLEACIATIDSNPDISKKQLQILAKVTREGLDEVRRSVNELRPDALQRFSLENAIRKMVDDTNSLSGVQVEFLCSAPVLKFDEDEENAIYRVVRGFLWKMQSEKWWMIQILFPVCRWNFYAVPLF